MPQWSCNMSPNESPTRVCRVSGEPLEPVADLGSICISNFLDEKDPAAPAGPLRLGIGRQSGLLQLMDTIDPDLMYRTYWYRSGTNETMIRQLREIVECVPRWARTRQFHAAAESSFRSFQTGTSRCGT